MKIAFVINQLSTEEGWYDTTLLTSTSVLLGHEVYVTEVGQLHYLENGHMGAMAIKVPSTKFKSNDHYINFIKSKEAERVKISTADLEVVFLRNNPSEEDGDRSWAATAGMIFGQVAVAKGVLVLNDPYALMTSYNKLYFQHFPEEVRPRTIITRDVNDIKEFYKKEKEKIIVKPLLGSGGKDVFLLDNSTNINQIVESITRGGFVIAQEYLPDAKNGDTRVIMINGKILQVRGKYAAMQRVNKAGDIRSNLHAGGTTDKKQVDEKIKHLCSLVAPKLIRDGMFMVGVDIVGDKIMELNLDSPGGLVSMERMEKEKFTSAVISAVERKVAYQKSYMGTLPNAFLATLDV
jgi:glutathione synthase